VECVSVELDDQPSAYPHQSTAFDHDRSRDRVLQAEGWRVIRVTWRQLHDETAALVADLRGLLCADGYAS
jgi:very-short-patch-repair endonuclease